jgi:hypothetical protein
MADILRLCAMVAARLTRSDTGRRNRDIAPLVFALGVPLAVIDQVYTWARSALKRFAGTGEAAVMIAIPDACELGR